MRKTKILATLGPASGGLEIIEELMLAGMNGVRINFSHGTYESHTELIENVKLAREKLQLAIPLLLDTRGPEIRIKTFKDGEITLEEGQEFTLTTQDIDGDGTRVSVTYEGLPGDLKSGDRVLIDDGLIELRVKEVKNTDIVCTVLNGGHVGGRKGVNVPGVSIKLPALTEKDKEDIKFGIKMGFDYIAASFVRSAVDVFMIKQVLDDNGGEGIEIIAKIESQEGVDNLDEILQIASGIMVARGDLGVEIPPEEVPLVQKKLIATANRMGKPVITATQMLESMVTNPRPTRAEASDVANAVFDGTDTLMLSGETASGKHPVEAVKMMSIIAETAESAIDYSKNLYLMTELSHKTITNATSHSVCTTANDLNAACISTVTKSGFTARMLSKFRPNCPIVACTNDLPVWRKMNLVWGCIPAFSEETPGHENVFDIAVAQAVKANVAKNGDIVIVSAGLPYGGSGSTNTMKVEIVGNVILKGKGTGEKRASAKACVVKAPIEAEKYFDKGDVLVTPFTNNELLPYIKKASAIVVGMPENSDYVHAEVTGMALDIPVVVCRERVAEIVPHGLFITVDPKNGFVYNGVPEDAE